MTNEQIALIIDSCNKTDDLDFVIKCAKDVVKTKNPYHICDFAEFCRHSDNPQVMPILEGGMFATGDLIHCYEFAFCMADHDKNFNLKKFEELIIINELAKIEYYFLECVKGTNVDKITKNFLSTKNKKWIKAYVENDELDKPYNNLDLQKYCNCLQDDYLPKRLEKYRNNPQLAEEDAIKSKDPLFINEVMEYCRPVNLDKLFEAMMATDDLLHIYEMYCSVSDLTEVQKNIVLEYMKNNKHLNSAKYMYYICAYTDLAREKQIEMLEAAKRTGNEKYIKKIETVIKPVGIKK